MEDRSGVSPVIATILLVAVTVVLAAVMYVTVTGFVGIKEAAPRIVISSPYKTADGNWLFEVVAGNPATDLAGFDVVVYDGNAVLLERATLQVGAVSSSGSLILKFTDLSGNGKLSSGDYFMLMGTDTTTSYRLAVIWKDTGDMVADAEVVQ